MVARTKIQDEREVLRWFEEGRTYTWMVQQYRDKYNIETTPSMWSEFRSRHGLNRRISQDDSLLPWRLEPQHRWQYPAVMLRAEARRREGKELPREDLGRLNSWLARLEREDVVIAYDPQTVEGFAEVPRRADDVDIVRAPVTVGGKPKRGDVRGESRGA